MTDFTARFFADDLAIRRIGHGLLDCSLPREVWTHEAHLAACIWLIRERIDIMPERDLRSIIARYNVAVGGINDDTQGYHETLTQCFIRAAHIHLEGIEQHVPLVEAVNAILVSPFGARDWPLAFYSRDRLFSIVARRDFIAPDLAPLP